MAKFIGATGIQKLVVFPGAIKAPTGLFEFFTMYEILLLQPALPTAVITMLKEPKRW